MGSEKFKIHSKKGALMNLLDLLLQAAQVHPECWRMTKLARTVYNRNRERLANVLSKLSIFHFTVYNLNSYWRI
jgi:hypothetical protein